MSTPKGKFYLTGLGLLIGDTKFTDEENIVLHWLCSKAAESDAVYWDAVTSLPPGSAMWHSLQQLKETFRRLGRQEILQAHYDRAAQL